MENEFNNIQMQTEKRVRKKSDLVATIEDLDLQIDELTKALDTLMAELP